MNNFRSKTDRVDVILNIVRQLKSFPNPNPRIEEPIDLYKDDYEYVVKLKKIFTDYIKQDDDKPHTLRDFKGTVFLTETLKKDIEYILPVNKNREPLFVIRMNTNKRT
jgi:hypothetical protein